MNHARRFGKVIFPASIFRLDHLAEMPAVRILPINALHRVSSATWSYRHPDDVTAAVGAIDTDCQNAIFRRVLGPVFFLSAGESMEASTATPRKASPSLFLL